MIRPLASVFRRSLVACIAFALMTVLVCPVSADGGENARSLHPQDGPHADLRLAVEDSVVRLSASINLAFIDEVIPIARESDFAVSDPEAERLVEQLTEFFREDVTLTIDGVEVTPVVEALTVLNDYDPATLALYPRSGARGLIRAAAVLRYPAASKPEAVDFDWPVYPPSFLAAETDGPIPEDGPPPPMVIDVLIQAVGLPVIKRISEADPVASWRRDGSDVAFENVPDLEIAALVGPPPPAVLGGDPVVRTVLFVVGLVMLVLVAAARTPLRRVSLGLSGVIAVGFSFVGANSKLSAPWQKVIYEQEPALAEGDVRRVFDPLHTNLYRAFEYAEPSDIYDALARSVSGDLLPRLYEQIRTSFIQAEQDGLIGTVTGIDKGEFRMIEVSLDDEAGPRVTVEQAWSVDGTVYHYGHSHTRTNGYRAEFDLAPLEDGWRIVGQRVLDQRRLDDGTGAPTDLPTANEDDSIWTEEI